MVKGLRRTPNERVDQGAKEVAGTSWCGKKKSHYYEKLALQSPYGRSGSQVASENQSYLFACFSLLLLLLS
jgi:hypothetical protein